MTPDQYCQRKAAQSGSSFYYSFLFLPPERRRAISALYAYCREVDDIVDECTDAGVARTKLAWWRDQVSAIYEGTPQHPVARALVPVVAQFRLQKERLLELIDGMEMDLTQHRYADFDALKPYCFRVAGVVGLLSAEIFGYENPDTLNYAENLGMAFQLTNIIRDVGEDARRDRVYLPLDELARYQVSVSDIMHARESDGFRQLMEMQIERALGYYSAAFAFLPAADRRAQRPGLVMAAIYRTLLDEIRTDGSKVLTQRTSLTPLRKLWIAWKTWVQG
jgi:15-cis-phytoene synthase